MLDKLVLSDEEWEIVLDLLERERRELPAEVRHTDNRAYRHRLEERLDTVEDLIRRLREALATAPAAPGG